MGGTGRIDHTCGAASGQKLRLRGRGLPAGNTAAAGDQFVVIKIVAPPAQSAKEKEAYERMRKDFDFDARADWP